MSETKFTPGPWESSSELGGYGTADECRFAIRSDDTDDQVGYVLAVTIGDTATLRKQESANASLIASAPEMYKALKSLIKFEMPIRAEKETLIRWNSALTAIAHAEGRQ